MGNSGIVISNIKITGADSTGRDAAKEAEARKKAANETIEEAWERIFSMKNADSVVVKLRAVKHAMQEGLIGREAPKVGKKQGKFSKTEALRLYDVLAEMQREQKLSDLVANTPENYILITDLLDLQSVVDYAMEEPEIAVDTETTGLDVYLDVIVGVSITIPSRDEHFYIPITPTEDERALPAKEVFDTIAPLMEEARVGKVLHNAIYDIAMFRRHGITLRGLAWDTMTAMHLLNENEPSYKLKDLAPLYLGAESDTFTELFGKDAKFAEVPLDIALVYAAKDTDLTWRLYKYQRYHMERFPKMYKYYTTIEVPLLVVIADLESNGYILDLDFAKEYGEQLRQQAAVLYTRLMNILGPFIDVPLEEFNLNSGPQLKPVLERAIGKTLPNLDAKKTLKPLRKKHEVIDVLMDYRKIAKLSSTYIDKLPGKQNPTTGRWHSRFNPMGTVTGRFSSGKDEEDTSEQGFNVQNQPKEAREMFVAPPGKVIVGADFKAQEIRCVANLSQEPALIEAFAVGRDPYASLASDFHGKPYEEVYKMADGEDTPERKQMKVGMLAAIYGTSKWTLSEQLNTTPDAAQEFLDAMFAKLDKLAAWVTGTQEFASKNGFVWIGDECRKRRLPDAKLKQRKIPYGQWNNPKFEADRKHNGSINRAKRQGPNARVQGESSIQMKTTMVRAYELCQSKPGWRLWGTVHDELLFEIPENFTREDIAEIERVMLESYVFGNVDNGTDIEVMKVWGKGVSVDKWFKQKEEEAKC